MTLAGNARPAPGPEGGTPGGQGGEPVLHTSASTRLSRYRWVVIVTLFLHQQATLILTSALGLLLPLLERDLDFTPRFAGWLGASRFLGPILLTLPASLYLARMRSPLTYAGLLGASGCLMVATGLAPSAIFLLIGLAVYSTAAMLVQIPQARTRLQWVGPHEFGLVVGITLGLAAGGQSSAIVAVPYLLPLLGGWRGLFFVVGAFTLLMAVLWPLILRIGRGREVKPPEDAPEAAVPLRETLARAVRHRTFALVGLTLLANAGAWAGFQLFLPSYLHDERGIDLRTVGWVAGVMPLGGMLGTVVGGWFSDRLGRRRPAIWPLALMQPACYLLLLAPLPVPVLMLLGFLVGLGVWAPGTALNTMAHEVPGASEDDVVVGQGVVRSLMGLGNLAFPVAIGLAAGSLSLGASLAGLSLLPLAVAALGWLLPETGPAARSPAGPRAAEAPGKV